MTPRPERQDEYTQWVWVRVSQQHWPGQQLSGVCDGAHCYALHCTKSYQTQKHRNSVSLSNDTVLSTEGLPMGSLLTSQRPAVWPAMLRGDTVNILDNMMVT